MVEPPEYRTPIQSPRMPKCPPAPRKKSTIERYRAARAFELEEEWPRAEICDINRLVEEEIRDMLVAQPTANALMNFIINKIENA